MNLVTNQQAWQSSATPSTHGSFLQSWAYGDFLISQGRQIKRWQLTSTNEVVQGIYYPSVLASYTYVPRAVLTKKGLHELLTERKQAGDAFIRFEQALDQPIPDGFATKTAPLMQQHHTWVLSLEPNTETLLDQMHRKTRYNIRLAEKKQVYIKEEKHLDILMSLQSITTDRNGFSGYTRAFCQGLLALPTVNQFIAYTKDHEPIATIVTLQDEDCLLYYIGASSHEHKKLMAPYALQWHVIQYAKAHGCAYYDFWGAASPVAPDHESATTFHTCTYHKDDPLAGVTRFKAGFGGNHISFPGAVDIVLAPARYLAQQCYRRLKPVRFTGHPQ